MWKDECAIARFFNYTCKPCSIKQKAIINVLNQLFPTFCTESIDWHKIAVAIGIIHHKVFIFGRPGTGKTSIIAKLITALLLLYDNNLHFKMVAPTGKSAALLTKSFNMIINNISKSIKKLQKYTLLKQTATTIHYLLGSRLYNTNTQYNGGNYSDLSNLNLLIIDEASMIGLSILAKLITAIPIQTKVIFLGDHHQLCSIEPGAIFRDMYQFTQFSYSNQYSHDLTCLTGYTLPKHTSKPLILDDNNHIVNGMCVLNKNYRFSENSGINKLAVAIHSGDHNQVLSLLYSNIYLDLNYICLKYMQDYITMIDSCIKPYYDYFKAIKHSKKLTTNILDVFNNYRILCALRDGPFGIIYINHCVEQMLCQKRLIHLHNSMNYVGKPIIILRNEPSLGLSNGDHGLLWLDANDILSAYFFDMDNNTKIIPVCYLPKYETCFAMTVHKAQGSEFEKISIILPNQHLPILTRELLYTAVTRARKHLFLYTTDEVIIHSVNLITKRNSGLYNRIIYNNMYYD